MSYFPLFIELDGKPVLIAGGGSVALRKTKTLLPYGPHITVIAPKLCPELGQIPGLRLLRRPFQAADLPGCALAIAATGDRGVNHQIAALCREQSIPVNVVDDPAACTFLFPALVRRGRLSVGICTGGASPAAASYLRQQLEQALPEQTEALLDWLSALRPVLKQKLPEAQRAGVLSALLRAGLAMGRPLTTLETDELLETIVQEEAE